MKVLIINDGEDLGPKGKIVEVADGYAKNFLIPKGLVIAATPQNLKAWEAKIVKIQKEQTALKTRMETLAQKISSVKIIIKHKVGEEGKLFGSVTGSDIAEALKVQTGLEIDRKKIVLDEPIKFLGSHQVPLKLEPEVTATINLIVEKSDE